VLRGITQFVVAHGRHYFVTRAPQDADHVAVCPALELQCIAICSLRHAKDALERLLLVPPMLLQQAVVGGWFAMLQFVMCLWKIGQTNECWTCRQCEAAVQELCAWQAGWCAKAKRSGSTLLF
jgi:hypothetical protein